MVAMRLPKRHLVVCINVGVERGLTSKRQGEIGRGFIMRSRLRRCARAAGKLSGHVAVNAKATGSNALQRLASHALTQNTRARITLV